MAKDFDPRCHIGEVHGIYTIVDMLEEKDKYRHWIYKCICNECGFIKFSHYGAISGEKSKATQCVHLRANGSPIVYDNHQWSNRRIGNIFSSMVGRCYNQNDKSYRWYGGKGIEICSAWLNDPIAFERWSFDNGYTDNLTIDRIDSDKNYCPENCQWIPLSDNSRRAGVVNWITVGSETLTGKQWANKLDIGPNTINRYIHKFGEEKTKELIVAMLQNPPETKETKYKQSWFDVYGIQV